MDKEEWYVILNMNCKYEICRKCPKSGLFKGSYEECEKWIEQKKKEEKKDEMKNRISMALKDPILQQGFEIICKDFAELEKENADLKEEINKIAFARGNLEEENAELKGLKDVATLIRANNDTVTTLMQLNNMLVSKNQQLTKAKELLKKLLSAYTSYADSFDDRDNEIVEEAEQFLKDSEVEK